jgi:hypothetical protein
MRFTEIDLFGIYVAPMSLLLVVAWLVTIGLRRIATASACCVTCGIRVCSCLPFTWSCSPQ